MSTFNEFFTDAKAWHDDVDAEAAALVKAGYTPHAALALAQKRVTARRQSATQQPTGISALVAGAMERLRSVTRRRE